MGDFRNSDALWNDFYFTAPDAEIKEGRTLASFCSEYAFSTSALDEESGLIAYYVSEDDVNLNISVDITPLEDNIASGEGVLLEGEGGKTYNLYYPPTTTEVALLTDNMLHGVLEPTDISEIYDDDTPTYVLYNNEFHISRTGTLAAGKAYLQRYASTSMPISTSTFSIGPKPSPTAIERVETIRAAEDMVYDLQGRIVTKPTKGLYIVNGKKMMVK